MSIRERDFRYRKKLSPNYGSATSEKIDYKNINLLRNHIMENGRIIPSRITGTPAKFQREVTAAVKQARFLAFLPYCDRHR